MPAPTKYERIFSFRSYQQNNPSVPLPGEKVDSELNALKATTDQTIDRLALIQRADGRLANSSVGMEQLEGGLFVGMSHPRAWETATAYAVNATVFESDKLYVCIVAHTSATFASDLAAQKWELIVDFTSLITDAEAAADLAESYKDLAQGAATASQGYADDAETAKLAAEAAAAAAAADVLEEFSAGVAEWYGDAVGTNAYSVDANDFTPETRTDGMKVRFRVPNGNTNNVTLTVSDYTGAPVVRHNGAEIGSGHWPAASIVEVVWSESLGKYVYDGAPTNLLAFLGSNNTFSGDNTHTGKETFERVVKTPVVLTPASTVAVDMSAGDNFTVEIDQNTILGAPSNTTDGQEGEIVVAEDGTGGWTFTLNAVWKPIGGDAVKIDTGADKKTVLGYRVIDSSNILYWRKWSEVRKPIDSYRDFDLGTVTASTRHTATHGLGRHPSLIVPMIECTTTDNGYAVGDRVLVPISGPNDTGDGGGTGFGSSAGMNTTEAWLTVAGGVLIKNKTTAGHSAITAASWKVIMRVFD